MSVSEVRECAFVDLVFLVSRVGRVTASMVWMLWAMVVEQRKRGVGHWFKVSRSAVMGGFGFSMSAWRDALRALSDGGVLMVKGTGRGTWYVLHPDLMTARSSGRMDLLRGRMDLERLKRMEARSSAVAQFEEMAAAAGGEVGEVEKLAKKARVKLALPVDELELLGEREEIVMTGKVKMNGYRPWRSN